MDPNEANPLRAQIPKDYALPTFCEMAHLNNYR